MERPRLSGLVVHWRAEEDFARLLAAWPARPDLELVVVDNSGELPDQPESFHLVRPGRNLGFAGGANRAAAAARGEAFLLLNPDVTPEPGALAALLDGLDAAPDAAGLAPRLLDAAGGDQCRWQLRPLPTAPQLLLHALFRPGPWGPAAPPPALSPIAQPAAAALLVRRGAFERLGGFDERFFPAWFEDVDFARRAQEQGLVFRYWPQARLRHRLGGSVAALGFGPFLAAYYGNLARYLDKHAGRAAVRRLALLLALGFALRLAALPLRRPRRARSRREAAAAFLRLLAALAVRGPLGLAPSGEKAER